MTQELAAPQRWPAGRWYTLTTLVLAIQLGLIFWLGQPRELAPPPPADFAPLLQVTRPEAAQGLAFSDPTLFALPHQESFSGPGWLTIPVQEFRPLAISDPAQFLELAQNRLGVEFERYMATNQPESLPALGQPELALRLPVVQEAAMLPQSSRLRVSGALAGRRLLSAPKLPSWPSSEILTNSVVQLLVDADGKPVSMMLLSQSGSTEADQNAIQAARDVRFAPLDPADPGNPLQGLTWGQLIFEWHTLPLPTTNGPAAASTTEPQPK